MYTVKEKGDDHPNTRRLVIFVETVSHPPSRLCKNRDCRVHTVPLSSQRAFMAVLALARCLC